MMTGSETKTTFKKHIFSKELLLIIIPRLICLAAFIALLYLLLYQEGFVTWFYDHAFRKAEYNMVFRSIHLMRFCNIFFLSLPVWFAAMILLQALQTFIITRQLVFDLMMILLMCAGYLLLTILLQPLSIFPMTAYLFLGFTIWRLNIYFLSFSPGFINEHKRFLLFCFLAITPGISDLLFLPLSLYFIRQALSLPDHNTLKRFSVSFSVTIALSLLSAAAFVFHTDPLEYGKTRGIQQLTKGNFYSMEIDNAADQLFTCNMRQSKLIIYDLNDLSLRQEFPIRTGELQDLRYNPAGQELYHFNLSNDVLMVLDARTAALKRASVQSYDARGGGSARVAYDNVSRTIAVTREDDIMLMFDMDTLRLLQRLPMADRNEFILFDEMSRHFILSYFDTLKSLRLITPRGESIRYVPAQRYQGGMALSRNLRELYVSLPLRSMIYVYDIDTYRLKRKIHTVFGVRNLAYDEDHKIIVAASLVNGYVDVIDAPTGRHLDRIFVGYYLREVCLDTGRRRAFVSSMIGGIYFFSY